MKFEYTEVWGVEHAIRGMRNPKESWSKSDSKFNRSYQESFEDNVELGENDLKLMRSLIKAGSAHRKFMRQIMVSCDITAPLYWWKEFDTYKVGVTTDSCSTMHKLTSTPITMDCFEMDDYCNVLIDNEDGVGRWSSDFWDVLIHELETLRNKYNVTKDKSYWKELIRLLPESWLQKRTVTMNYENLLAMCSKGQRRFHKLTEWSKSFIEWARSLPYAQELIFIDELGKGDLTMEKLDIDGDVDGNAGERFWKTIACVKAELNHQPYKSYTETHVFSKHPKKKIFLAKNISTGMTSCTAPTLEKLIEWLDLDVVDGCI